MIIDDDDSTPSNIKVEKSLQSDCSEDMWFTQISNQITLMTGAVLIHDEIPSDVKVKLSFLDNEIVESTAIKVVKSPAEGNCLFTSLAHQLNGFKMNSRMMKTDRDKLRADVVKYIKNNYELFKSQIKGRVYDNIEDQKRKGTFQGINSMENECKFFLNHLLPKNKYWGGCETLKAVSEMHEVNIIIMREEGQCEIVCRFDQPFNRTIIVVHVFFNDENEERNHFDSVSDISPNDVCILAQKIQEKLKKH